MEHYAKSTEVCILLLEDNGDAEYKVESLFLPESASSESSFTCVALLQDKESKGMCLRPVLGDDSFDEAVSTIIANAIGCEDDDIVDSDCRSSDDEYDESQSHPVSKQRRKLSSLPGKYINTASQLIICNDHILVIR